MSSIPQLYGSVQDVYDSGKDQASPVILLQDVHLNVEAQTNIAAILQELIDQKSVGLVAVEGAFDAFDFSSFRKFPNKKVALDVTTDALNKSLVGAPSFVGITSPTEPPAFLGVDSKENYDANLAALYASRSQKEAVVQALSLRKRKLQETQQKVFSKALMDFENLRLGYHKGTIGFGAYVKKLSDKGSELDLPIEMFLEAYAMESALDLKRVEAERRTVIEKLSKKLDSAEISRLVAQSLAYRTGRISFASYYQGIRTLCGQKGIDLQQTPHFANYIRYVLLSDGIKGESLFKSVEKLEQDVIAMLVVSDEERTLLAASEHFSLSEKLIDFSLTPNEWEKYEKLKASRAASLSLDLTAFEKFYSEADTRSHKMVHNVLANRSQQPVVFVLGGFHSPQVAELLRKEKTSYIIVSPKLTKIDGLAGSSYLSVFAQDKTPLDRLFAGEKLFVYPSYVLAGSNSAGAINPILNGVLDVENEAHTHDGASERTKKDENFSFEHKADSSATPAKGEIVISHTHVRAVHHSASIFKGLATQVAGLFKAVLAFVRGVLSRWKSGSVAATSFPAELFDESDNTDIGIASDNNGGRNRAAHMAFHVQGRFDQVLADIAKQLGVQKGSNGDYDFRAAVIRAGGRIKTDQFEMRIENDGILVILDSRFQRDHAGRGRRVAFARNESKARHELAELRAWIAYATTNGIATESDISNGLLGQRLRDWLNGRDKTLSEAELEERQKTAQRISDEFHILGLVAEHGNGSNSFDAKVVADVFKKKIGRIPTDIEMEKIKWSVDEDYVDPVAAATDLANAIQEKDSLSSNRRLASSFATANPAIDFYLPKTLIRGLSEARLDFSQPKSLQSFRLGRIDTASWLIEFKIDSTGWSRQAVVVTNRNNGELLGIYVLLNEGSESSLFARIDLTTVAFPEEQQAFLQLSLRLATQAKEAFVNQKRAFDQAVSQPGWNSDPVLRLADVGKLVNESPLKAWILARNRTPLSAGENFLLFHHESDSNIFGVTLGRHHSQYGLVTGNDSVTLSHEIAHALYGSNMKRASSVYRLRLSPGLQRFVNHIRNKRPEAMRAMRNSAGYARQFGDSEANAIAQWSGDRDRGVRYAEDTNVVNEIFARLVEAVDHTEHNYEGMQGSNGYPLVIHSEDIEVAIQSGLLPDWFSPALIGYSKPYIDDSYYLAIVQYGATRRGARDDYFLTAERIAGQLRKKYLELQSRGITTSGYLEKLEERFPSSGEIKKAPAASPEVSEADFVIASDGNATADQLKQTDMNLGSVPDASAPDIGVLEQIAREIGANVSSSKDFGVKQYISNTGRMGTAHGNLNIDSEAQVLVVVDDRLQSEYSIVGGVVLARNPQKARRALAELKMWASRLGVPALFLAQEGAIENKLQAWVERGRTELVRNNRSAEIKEQRPLVHKKGLGAEGKFADELKSSLLAEAFGTLIIPSNDPEELLVKLVDFQNQLFQRRTETYEANQKYYEVAELIARIQKARLVSESLRKENPSDAIARFFNDEDIDQQSFAAYLLNLNLDTKVMADLVVWLISKGRGQDAYGLFQKLSVELAAKDVPVERYMRAVHFSFNQRHGASDASPVEVSARERIRNSPQFESWLAADTLEDALGLFSEVSGGEIVGLVEVYYKDRFSLRLDILTDASQVVPYQHPNSPQIVPVDNQEFLIERMIQWSKSLDKFPYSFHAFNCCWEKVAICKQARAYHNPQSGTMVLSLEDGIHTLLHELGHAADPELVLVNQRALSGRPFHSYGNINRQSVIDFAARHGYQLASEDKDGEMLALLTSLIRAIFLKRRALWLVIARTDAFHDASPNRQLGFWEGFVMDLKEEKQQMKRALLETDRSILLAGNYEGTGEDIFQSRVGVVYDEIIQELESDLHSGANASALTEEALLSLSPAERERQFRLRAIDRKAITDAINVLLRPYDSYDGAGAITPKLVHRYIFEVPSTDTEFGLHEEKGIKGNIRKDHYEWFAERFRLFFSDPKELAGIDAEASELLQLMFSGKESSVAPLTLAMTYVIGRFYYQLLYVFTFGLFGSLHASDRYISVHFAPWWESAIHHLPWFVGWHGPANSFQQQGQDQINSGAKAGFVGGLKLSVVFVVLFVATAVSHYFFPNAGLSLPATLFGLLAVVAPTVAAWLGGVRAHKTYNQVVSGSDETEAKNVATVVVDLATGNWESVLIHLGEVRSLGVGQNNVKPENSVDVWRGLLQRKDFQLMVGTEIRRLQSQSSRKVDSERIAQSLSLVLGTVYSEASAQAGDHQIFAINTDKPSDADLQRLALGKWKLGLSDTATLLVPKGTESRYRTFARRFPNVTVQTFDPAAMKQGLKGQAEIPYADFMRLFGEGRSRATVVYLGWNIHSDSHVISLDDLVPPILNLGVGEGKLQAIFRAIMTAA